MNEWKNEKNESMNKENETKWKEWKKLKRMKEIKKEWFNEWMEITITYLHGYLMKFIPLSDAIEHHVIIALSFPSMYQT